MERMPLTFSDLVCAIGELELRVDAQAEILQALIDDYRELIAGQKRVTALAEEIRRRQDDGESWKGEGD